MPTKSIELSVATLLVGVCLAASAHAQPVPPPPVEPPPPPPAEPQPPPPPAEPQPPPAEPQPPPVAPQPPPPPVEPPPMALPQPPAPSPPPPPPGSPPGPPPGAPPPMGWGPAPLPPPPREVQRDGVTERGVPFAQRGHIAVDTATFLPTDGNGGVSSLYLDADIPVADRTFVTAVFPLAVPFSIGNPTLGAHHVVEVTDIFWITAGGSIGLPLADRDGAGVGLVSSYPRALWRLHLYYPQIVPLQIELGMEVHAGIVELRAELEPSLWAGIGRNDGVAGAFYHAFEVQIGHSIGGGLRMQGVALGSDVTPGAGSDAYQFAFSPFFVVRRELGFLRTGLMLPVDNFLGPPFKEDGDGEGGAWGFLLSVGIHVD